MTTGSVRRTAASGHSPEDRWSLRRVEDTDPASLQGGGPFLLTAEDDDGHRAWEILCAIRRHPQPEVYLTPVILATDDRNRLPAALVDGVDAVWNTEDHPKHPSRSLESRIDEILARASRMPPTSDAGDLQLRVRVLRMMATRRPPFTPERTTDHPGGWVYRRLQPLSSGTAGELLDVLADMEERRFVRGTFVDRVYACASCGSAFLSFQETCPDCESAHLLIDDWIHHFRCAFTGPMTEFAHEGQLVCPKCDHLLRQIGVDYDKPSIVYECQSCDQDFHDPEITCTCYECGHTASPDLQKERFIRRYAVTSLGESMATYGVGDALREVIGKSGRVLDVDAFRTLVQGEAARHERYGKGQSAVLALQLHGLERAHLELGTRTQELLEDLLATFSRVVRTSDYVTAYNESLFLFLLTETPPEGARRAGKRLQEGVEELLAGSLEAQMTQEVTVHNVDRELDLDALVEELLG